MGVGTCCFFVHQASCTTKETLKQQEGKTLPGCWLCLLSSAAHRMSLRTALHGPNSMGSLSPRPTWVSLLTNLTCQLQRPTPSSCYGTVPHGDHQPLVGPRFRRSPHTLQSSDLSFLELTGVYLPCLCVSDIYRSLHNLPPSMRPI